MRLPLLVTCALLALPLSAQAHYNMLLLATPSIERGKEVKLTYQWGHPFEHELFDAPKPETLLVIEPDGKPTDLLGSLKAITVKGEKQDVKAYELLFKPADIGDYVFVLKTPPIWMAAEGEFYQDTVKVVLHVQAQKGWRHAANEDFEITPLTRPYGLRAGTVFQASVLHRETKGDRHVIVASPDTLIEIERYNADPPKELPQEEFITRTRVTDPNGVVTCDLPDAGWWCLTAARKNGTLQHEGKAAILRERTTFWVHVADKAKP